jgi:hypothetical protein
MGLSQIPEFAAVDVPEEVQRQRTGETKTGFNKETGRPALFFLKPECRG